MTTATITILTRPAGAAVVLRHWLAIYAELTKARLSFFVVITAVVGYVMAAGARFDWLTLTWVGLGVALAAGSANALNQWLEVERDRLMPRTADRPLPAGRITPGHAMVFAIVCGVAGVGLLAVGVNLPAAGLALATIVLYVGAYTPLKVRTTLNTLVGAVVGAVPPMIGWAGASGGLEAGAWVLGAILFAWQMPHFLALAWMYRQQYERGGYRMLPSVDADGRLTAMTVVLYCLTLLAVTLAAALVGLSGGVYAAGAAGLGLWMLHLSLRLRRHRTVAAARKLFLASVIYLPLLMGLMVIDRQPTAEPPPTHQLQQLPTAAPDGLPAASMK